MNTDLFFQGNKSLSMKEKNGPYQFILENDSVHLL